MNKYEKLEQIYNCILTESIMKTVKQSSNTLSYNINSRATFEFRDPLFNAENLIDGLLELDFYRNLPQHIKEQIEACKTLNKLTEWGSDYLRVMHRIDYWIELKNGDCADQSIADYLDLTKEEYQNILISNRAHHLIDHDQECCFVNREDAEKAVKELELYEILAKLTE